MRDNEHEDIEQGSGPLPHRCQAPDEGGQGGEQEGEFGQASPCQDQRDQHLGQAQ